MKTNNIILFVIVFIFATFSIFYLNINIAEATSLSVEADGEQFVVGQTFDVSIILDTEGETVNAFEVFVEFPSDLLQVVSQRTGLSVVGLWVAPPSYNNQSGKIELRGGIPGGINVSRGLLTSFSFRVRASGRGTIKMVDSSRVFLNDGEGTDVLSDTSGASLRFVLPPPAGPAVSSPTHGVSGDWSNNSSVTLTWEGNGRISGYSYVLSREPDTVPDNIPEGKHTSIEYDNIADGRHYFHIKAFQNGVWGGITHIPISVDTSPPADFNIKVIPSPRTIQKQPILQFFTTDQFSGVEKYEIKVISLAKENSNQSTELLFVESQSPYILPALELGSYDVIVRATDRLGNRTDSKVRINIIPVFLQFVSGEGVLIRQAFIVSWKAIFSGGFALLVLLGLIAWGAKRRHDKIHELEVKQELSPHIEEKLRELKEMESKYKKTLMLLLSISASILFGFTANAQTLTPPIINTIPEVITNEEVFYAEGFTETNGDSVLLYIQNIDTGEILERNVEIESGTRDWFYRHDAFLVPGRYITWTQLKSGDSFSPPGPKYDFRVERSAIRIGSTSISRESIFLSIAFVLLLAITGLISFIIIYIRRAREKRLAFLAHLTNAETKIKAGFEILKRDIKAELDFIDKLKMSKELSEEEERRKERLEKDIEKLENYIDKEDWELYSERRDIAGDNQ